MAMSLNARVGPFDNASKDKVVFFSLPSSVSGVMSSIHCPARALLNAIGV